MIKKFFYIEIYYIWNPFVYGGLSFCIAEFGNRIKLYSHCNSSRLQFSSGTFPIGTTKTHVSLKARNLMEDSLMWATKGCFILNPKLREKKHSVQSTGGISDSDPYVTTCCPAKWIKMHKICNYTMRNKIQVNKKCVRPISLLFTQI